MDPISLTASVIAVATLAYNSGKALYDLIETYSHAHEIFQELNSDIDGLNNVLCSLQTIGGEDNGASFSERQCLCLKEVEPAIKNYSVACKAFEAKVGDLMSNSTTEHVSKRDKFMLHFKTNDIAAFRIQLSSYKSTLTIALLVVSIKTSSESNKELTTKIESAMGLLTGQMEGIKLAVQAAEDAGASSQSLMVGMAQTVQAISQCGDVCSAATAVAGAADGTATYRLVQAFDDVRFMMGSTNTQAIAGGSTRVFDSVVGRDRARVWIGDVSPKTALDFMNG